MKEKKYSTARAAQMIDVSTDTLKKWYRWYEDDNFKKPKGLVLPPYETNNMGTKFFDEDAIKKLKQFKKDLQAKYRGWMAKFNATYCWGKSGKKQLQNKEKKWLGEN